jgi:hypothetical protein
MPSCSGRPRRSEPEPVETHHDTITSDGLVSPAPETKGLSCRCSRRWRVKLPTKRHKGPSCYLVPSVLPTDGNAWKARRLSPQRRNLPLTDSVQPPLTAQLHLSQSLTGSFGDGCHDSQASNGGATALGGLRSLQVRKPSSGRSRIVYRVTRSKSEL